MTRERFGTTSRNRRPGLLFIFSFAYLVVFLFPQFGFSQRFFELDKKRKRLEVEFTIHRNLMVVPIYLNNQGPYNFILDTGVSMGLITNPALLDKLKLIRGQRVQITGAGSSIEKLAAYVVPNVKINGEGFHADYITLTALSEDVFNLSSYVGMPIDGILGYQFFNSFVIKLNFADTHLTLYHPDSFKYRKRHGTRVPIELIDQKPFVKGQMSLTGNTPMEIKLILDTGAGHALSLEQSSNAAIQVPTPAYRTQLGTGLNGSINGYISRIATFQLGKFHFKNMLTSFPDFSDVGAKVKNVSRNGNLGNEFLKRFQVIIDYNKNALYLRPNSLYRDKFEHDMCGVEIVASGTDYKRFIISRVEEGMPAAEAGLEPGDEILFINSKSAKDLTISQIDKLFRYRDNYQLFLVLIRDNRLIHRFITLRRRI